MPLTLLLISLFQHKIVKQQVQKCNISSMQNQKSNLVFFVLFNSSIFKINQNLNLQIQLIEPFNQIQEWRKQVVCNFSQKISQIISIFLHTSSDYQGTLAKNMSDLKHNISIESQNLQPHKHSSHEPFAFKYRLDSAFEKLQIVAQYSQKEYVGQILFQNTIDSKKIKQLIQREYLEIISIETITIKIKLLFFYVQLKAKSVQTIKILHEPEFDKDENAFETISQVQILTRNNKKTKKNSQLDTFQEQFIKPYSEKDSIPNHSQKQYHALEDLKSKKSYPDKIMLNYITKNSSIIQTPQEQNSIQTFFQDKQIQSLQLLYRASQHNFSTSKFHQYCDQIPANLVLCKTQFGKKIGGFTPHFWQKTNQRNFLSDHSGLSFLFSLTNKDKFTLQDKKISLQNVSGYGPVFGDYDFFIGDHANEEIHSGAKINRSYKNQKYLNDQFSFNSFCGNPKEAYFKITQWEVWQIKFTDQPEKLTQIKQNNFIQTIRQEEKPKIRVCWNELKQHSQIIVTNEQQKTMQELFENKWCKFQLLYRGSDNNFEISKFHKKCDGFYRTLVLCETEFNKKIGGYSVMPWLSSQNMSLLHDSTNKSFTFSLTHGDKFVSNESLIMNNRQKGPIFGEFDLAICDKSNQSGNSFAFVNSTFKNKNYKSQEKSSFEKFCGNQNGPQFKLKEWEVWRVIQYFDVNKKSLKSQPKLQTKFACQLSSDSQQFMITSRVISTPEETQIIRNFFKNKKIKTAQLLYRASEQQFSIAMFHEKCDYIPNTLTVIWTEFNKKIGGFTPLEWKCPDDYAEYVRDQSEGSFIFSVTHNDKFILNSESAAIKIHQSYGPTFGSTDDLTISNESNTSRNSRANIGRSYENANYKFKDNASWERFHGGAASKQYFNTRDWEVWELQFE